MANSSSRVEPRLHTGGDIRANVVFGKDMTAIAVDERHLAPSSCLEEPLYFPSGDHQLFGWLHRPAADQMPDTGLVICKPFGYESICAHRSIRAFADAAAAVGVPSLRFDYVGTGDSEDAEPGVEQLAVWTQDVLAAIRELQRRTGVEHVCLLGIRLGALLATLAAAQCQLVSALIVIAPVISGRRYLRELRIVQLAASQDAVVAPPVNMEPESAKTTDTASFEVSGFSLFPATIAALAQTDLMKMGAVPTSQMLIIDRGDLPAARAWTDIVSRLGARTDYLCLPGIVEMIWTAPHFGTLPQLMISAMSDWLERFLCVSQTQTSSSSMQRHPPATDSPMTVLRLQCDAGAPQIVLTERPVFFALEPLLFGIVTEPRSGEVRRRGVILINDGATYHVGANRMNVTLARRWARHGYVVLRIDLAGLGESAARPGQPVNEVFPSAALEDIRSAIDFVRSNFGTRDITLAGLCSGAYHSLRAAVGGLPVNRILLMNPQNFFWKEGMTISDLQLTEIVRGPSKYRERMLSKKNWKKLLAGEADVRRIASVHIRHAWFVIISFLRDCAKYLHIHLPRDLGRELEQIVARGVQVVFVFSRGDVGIDLLKIQGGSSLKRLGERCRIHIIDGADHIFSQSSARGVLENILSNELFARGPESVRTAAQTVATPSR